MSVEDRSGRVSDTKPAADFATGRRLHAFRRYRGLSQRELARRAGLTNGSLSLIEQGKVSPSIHSLEKLLGALAIPLRLFFDHSYQPAPPVLPPEDCENIVSEACRHSWSVLPLEGRVRGYLLQSELSGSRSCHCNWYPAQGLMMGLLTRGELVVELDGEKLPLTTGTRFHFSSRRAHGFHNETDAVALFSGVLFDERRS